MEVVEFCCMALVNCPGFLTVEECGHHSSMDFDL